MFELVAEGPEAGQRLKSSLLQDRPLILGRGETDDLTIAWDPHISRAHLKITCGKDRVQIAALSSATNPVFSAGREVKKCDITDGEHFVIGSTTFQITVVLSEQDSPQQVPVEQLTFSREELSRIRFRDADRRIEVLTRLPQVIWSARTDEELFHQVVHMILTGVTHAEAAAVVRLGADQAVNVLHGERRRQTSGQFRPSTRLVNETAALAGQSVLHVWERSDTTKQDYTAMAEFDWAFCTPVPLPEGDGWGLYVAGRIDRPISNGLGGTSEDAPLQADVKFTELVAEIVGAIRRLNRQDRQLAVLRQFLAPPILAMLGDDLQIEMLEPRECEVTVLFCDLRGFSQRAEEAADDLRGLLDRVSRALGVMTHHILEFGGVTGDFQGDAAMGFWGWPFPSDDAPLQACRAALGIRATFAAMQSQPDHPLANFQMGIGIAQGRAVAGKIGTSDQVKFTVFGPVVNLASRLESLTKQLRVPILMDDQTAAIVRNRFPKSEGRTRRLARVLPYGMETPVVVSELLPAEAAYPELTDAHLQQYERGVDLFTHGQWEEAYQCLHQMPVVDRAQDFLTLLIAQHDRVAPPNWDGIVRLSSK